MTLDQLWMRILDSGFSGMAYMLLASIILLVRGKKGTGHHRGLLYTALILIAQACSNFATAWDLAHGGYQLILWVQTPLAVAKLTYVSYVWVNISDLIITLRRSERGELLRRDFLADKEQERLNLDYVISQTKQKVAGTLSFISKRAEHDHPDATVGQCSR